jgi:hypothetical protein
MLRIVLLRLLESYFRHRWLYPMPLILAIVAGVAYILLSPPEYLSYGNIYIEKDTLLATLTSEATDGNWWATPAEVTTNEIYELIGTNSFVRSAIAKTALEENMAGGPDVVEDTMIYFREAITVSPNGDKLVGIAATSDDPLLAQQIVNSVMETYIQWRLNNDYRESVVAQEFFEDQIEPYSRDVENARADLVAYLNANPAPVRGDRPANEEFEIARLQSELEQAEVRLRSARDNEESARLALVQSESLTRQSYLIIDEPALPRESEFSISGFVLDLAIFVIAGAFLTLAGIALSALLDRTLRFPIDVRHSLSLPLLAMIPVAQPIPRSAGDAHTAVEVTDARDAQGSDAAALQPQT